MTRPHARGSATASVADRDASLGHLLATVASLGALMDDSIAPEERLVLELPYPWLFRQLVDVHSFVAFDLGDVRVFSNLRGEEDNLEDLLHDRFLIPPLVDAGFLPFARPEGGSYDPICFDVRQCSKGVDAPIVLMDHESILTHKRVPSPEFIASGMLDLPRWWSREGWVAERKGL
jgi:hypothetical protein